MRFTCRKADLANAISRVLKSVPAKTTMPILECILIDAGDKTVLVGNDMEISIETVLDGDVAEPGITAVDAKLLMGIVAKMPDADIEIISEKESLIVKSGKSKFNLACRDGEEFPRAQALDGGASFTMRQAELKNMIMSVVFAISQNDTNKVMRGVNVLIDGEIAKFTALDGHRIAVREIGIDEGNNGNVIIPGKTLNELAKILSDTGDVRITLDDAHAMFEFDGTMLVTRLIEGKYLEVDKVMQIDHKTKVTVDRRSLMDCLDRSLILTNVNDKKPVKVTVNKDTMAVEITTALGSFADSVAVSKEGDDLVIAVNPRFMLDALKAISDDEVDLYFVSKSAPCIIKGEGYAYLVLPVNMA